MTLTLSQVVLPTYTKGLATLTHILNVAADHAKANGIDADAEFVGARLAPDMLPLSFQVQNATNTVRRTLARLQGQEDQPWADGETTIAQLLERVEKAKEVVKAADAAVVDAKAEEEVDLPFGPKIVLRLTSQASALDQGIPNFFFHLQTAYAILRSKGVPIGKRDFIGNFLPLPQA